MRKIKYLFVILTMLVSGTFLSSCNKDDNKQNTPDDDTSVVGIWKTSDKVNPMTYEFRTDGTGVITSDEGTANIKYTYSSKDKILKYNYVNDNVVYNCTVQRTGNTLMLTYVVDGKMVTLILEKI